MTEPGFIASFVGGLLSFLSPCVLPLVPAYLSYISGTNAVHGGADDAPGGQKGRGARTSKARTLAASLAFSAGFGLAFTILGVAFSGGALFAGRAGLSGVLNIVGGLVVMLLGLNMIFDFLKFLNADTRLVGRIAARNRRDKAANTRGSAGAFVLGLAFAAGWSPCIGPILASILLYAGKDGDILRSAALLGAYSLGFAVPFIASGIFLDRLKPLVEFFKRRGKEIRIVSGLMLIAIGLTMATGDLGALSGIAMRAGYALAEFARTEPSLSKIADSAALALLAFPSLRAFRKKKPTTRATTVARTAWIALLAILAALELGGIISLSAIAGRWLQFTGI